MENSRLIRISLHHGASEADFLEAARRCYYDGIPRTVYESGHIMKWDWICPDTVDVDDELLEDHVRRLIEAQDGQQG
jgi:hypothetical protein